MLDRQNHAAGGANGSIMVGMFVYLCLTSKKPSEREFFVPAGTDLGVKLLTPKCIPARTKNSLSEDFLLAKHKDTNIPTMMEPLSSSAAWF
jgi:hypothetical protein